MRHSLNRPLPPATGLSATLDKGGGDGASTMNRTTHSSCSWTRTTTGLSSTLIFFFSHAHAAPARPELSAALDSGSEADKLTKSFFSTGPLLRESLYNPREFVSRFLENNDSSSLSLERC